MSNIISSFDADAYSNLTNLSLPPNAAIPDKTSPNQGGPAQNAAFNLNNFSPSQCSLGHNSAQRCQNDFFPITIVNNFDCATIKIKKITIKATSASLPAPPSWYSSLTREGQSVVINQANSNLNLHKKGMFEKLDETLSGICSVFSHEGSFEKDFSSVVSTCSGDLNAGELQAVNNGGLSLAAALNNLASRKSAEMLSQLNAQRATELGVSTEGVIGTTATPVTIRKI